jgi:hypothetical protein
MELGLGQRQECRQFRNQPIRHRAGAQQFQKDYRVVSGIKIGVAGKVSQTEDVIPTTAQILPGNRWIKLTRSSR